MASLRRWPAPMRGPHRKQWQNAISLVLSGALLLGLWAAASAAFGSEILFPSPGTVAATGLEMLTDGSLLEHAAVSMGRILTGFVLGCAVGAPMGLLMGNSTLVRRLLEPYIEFFRFIPALSLITLALIWFGPGEGSKLFLLVYATMFIVILNAAAGVGSVSQDHIRAAQSLGARRHRVFLSVVVPETVPYIITGMRLALANTFTTIVAAEIIAAQSGLGYVIFSSRVFLATDAIFVAIITLGLLGYTTDRLLRLVSKATASRYLRRSAIA